MADSKIHDTLMFQLKILPILPCFLTVSLSFGQDHYKLEKQKELNQESPFQKIIKRELPAQIEYEDDRIIAFVPLRPQAPVHLLVVPKKRIATMNELTEEDVALVGSTFLVAKQLAAQEGIAESGYRLVFNTNEDSGQSVFH